MATYIYLQPIGRSKAEVLDQQTSQRLCLDLTRQFGLPCKSVVPLELTEDAYDPLRDQYLAAIILSNLKCRGFPEAEKVLGLVSEDLYADELNFVFGQAELGGKYGIVSIARLKPPPARSQGFHFAAHAGDERLYYERILKECVHELGHTFGLGHCPNVQCVMHFSNALRDTDIKLTSFCAKCEAALGARRKRAAS